MSTQLFREFDDLMKILKVEMKKIFKNKTNSAFNIKIIKGDSRKYDLKVEYKINKRLQTLL